MYYNQTKLRCSFFSRELPSDLVPGNRRTTSLSNQSRNRHLHQHQHQYHPSFSLSPSLSPNNMHSHLHTKTNRGIPTPLLTPRFNPQTPINLVQATNMFPRLRRNHASTGRMPRKGLHVESVWKLQRGEAECEPVSGADAGGACC